MAIRIKKMINNGGQLCGEWKQHNTHMTMMTRKGIKVHSRPLFITIMMLMMMMFILYVDLKLSSSSVAVINSISDIYQHERYKNSHRLSSIMQDDEFKLHFSSLTHYLLIHVMSENFPPTTTLLTFL